MNEKTDNKETTLVEDRAAPAPQRDPATVAHEQRFGGSGGSAPSNAAADVGSGGDGGEGGSAGAVEQQQAETKGILMRPGHRLLTDKEVAILEEIDFLENELQQRYTDAMKEAKNEDAMRCLSLARTNLQQSAMWATRGIAK